jgi:6-pyruvoyltetrahydropterin/6-carboxytetrahydropterin synthase
MKRATIQRRYDFEAAHRLPHVPNGHKCKTMHGHSYEIVVQVTGVVRETGPEAGMVLDFGILDAAASALRDRVDHTTLNDTLHGNPTVENMVEPIYHHFRLAVGEHRDGMGSWWIKVWLYEGPRSCAVYPPEE